MVRPTTLSAFPSNVLRLDRSDFKLGGGVGVECLSNAVFAQHQPTNTRWVYKAEIHSEGVLAEAMAWLLCDDLGIPIPRAAAVREPAGRSTSRPYAWASERERIRHWAPEVIDLVGNPTIFAALVVVDAWMGNPDRHDENLVVRVGAGSSVELIALDFDGAWVGRPHERGRADIAAPTPERITPLDPHLWRADVGDWVERARAVPSGLLREYVTEACELSGATDGPAVLSWLQRRQNVLEDLAKQVSHHYELMRS